MTRARDNTPMVVDITETIDQIVRSANHWVHFISSDATPLVNSHRQLTRECANPQAAAIATQ
jgi:hypothetical protein